NFASCYCIQFENDLTIFYVINTLNYVDHGAIASNDINGNLEICDDFGICTTATGIYIIFSGEDFHLRNFQDGVLSYAFMVGLLIVSPIFASLDK
ncbi:hypothetical protein HN51_065985, partial [Arachis hypogaea]